jgi:type II secretory pathway pseudopilin PulG
MMKCFKNNSGITLVEILVATVIGAIVTAAAVEIYIHHHKNWIIQEGVSDLQQNGRAAIEELSSKIRMAGYRIPEGLEAIISGSQVGTLDPDSITLVFLKEPACTTTIYAPMPQPSSELKCMGDVSCFEVGMWCYIWDPFAKEGEFFEITQVQNSPSHLQHSTMKLSKSYPAGSKIYIFDVMRFFVDDWTDTLHPRLMRQEFSDTPDIYADNITNLQIRYHMSDGSVLDTITYSQYVRRIDIDVVARTNREDLLLDNYRYDTLRTTVQVRNLAYR